MNNLPIIFRFFSGSVTPLSSDKNLSFASLKTKLALKFFLNMFTTICDSFFLNKPWSTKKHVNWLPIALSIIAAVTELSTPPLNAHKTWSSPTFALISAILSFKKFSTFHVGWALQISNKKFFKICIPFFVWTTSGWNCNA